MNTLNLLEKTKQLYEINQSIIDTSLVTAKEKLPPILLSNLFDCTYYKNGQESGIPSSILQEWTRAWNTISHITEVKILTILFPNSTRTVFRNLFFHIFLWKLLA